MIIHDCDYYRNLLCFRFNTRKMRVIKVVIRKGMATPTAAAPAIVGTLELVVELAPGGVIVTAT